MRPALWLFASFLALYALTSGGHFYASDDVQKLAVLDALWDRHDIAIPGGWVHGADGRRYAWFTLTSSLLMLPGWALGKLAATAFPVVPAAYATRFCVALENAAFSAGLVTLVYALARRAGAAADRAVFAAVALGLGTMVWPYAKTAWSEPAATLALYAGLGLVWIASRRPGGRAGLLAAAGWGLGLAGAIRQELLLVAAGAIAWWIWQGRRAPRALAAELVCLVAPVLALQAVEGAYAACRWGSVFGFPNYHLPQKNVVMAEGRVSWSLRNLYQYTFSPNQGLPWYSPALLAGLAGLGAWARERRAQATLFVVALGPLALFYVAGWGMSSWAWGLRYAYVFLPALVLPAAWAWRPGRRTLAGALFALGVVVQLVAIVPNPIELYEHELARHPGLTILGLMRGAEHAPLVLAWREDPETLARGAALLAGRPLPGGNLRDRRDGLPDLWWILVLLEPVPRAAVAGAVAALVAIGLAGAFGLRHALARPAEGRPDGRAGLPSPGLAE